MRNPAPKAIDTYSKTQIYIWSFLVRGIKNLLSRYNLRYPRSLVYMLQASEYNVRDYLAWYHQTRDFTHIEKRKQLEMTLKAHLMLGLTWLTLIFWAIAVMWYVNSTGSDVPLMVGTIIIILSPFYLPYIIIIPLLIIKIIQWPIECWIINQARQKMKNHKAIKIGIAGSFGKTTMREILKTVLSEGKKVAAAPNNFNTPLGISQFVKTLKGDEDVLIFELGEYYPGDVKKLCELTRPNIGIITGINEAHLSKFKSLERTTKTIYELADYLEAELPKTPKILYVNGENELACKNARVGSIIYDRQSVNDWKIENPQTSMDGTSFILTSGNIKLELKSALVGLHQIGPLAAAVHIAIKLGLSFDQIVKGINKTKPFEHRLEPKTGNDGVITLDDSYNGNPDGVKAVIEFLGSLQNQRRFYVTPGLVEMGNKTEEVHKEIGRSLAQAKIEKIVLIKNSVTPYIEEGLKERKYEGDILWFDDALSAFAALPNLTVKGDVVLLQNDWPDQYQ
jgi:UDP-N-acetylmuramoyl-tripeptide--D-alanyl-D-alanine ligase